MYVLTIDDLSPLLVRRRQARVGCRECLRGSAAWRARGGGVGSHPTVVPISGCAACRPGRLPVGKGSGTARGGVWGGGARTFTG